MNQHEDDSDNESVQEFPKFVLARYYRHRGQHIKKFILSRNKVYKFNTKRPIDDYWVQYEDAHGVSYEPAQILDVDDSIENLRIRDKASDAECEKKGRSKFSRRSVDDVAGDLINRDGDVRKGIDQNKEKSKTKGKNRKGKPSKTSRGKGAKIGKSRAGGDGNNTKGHEIQTIDPELEELLATRVDNLNNLDIVDPENFHDANERFLEVESRLLELIGDNSKLTEENRVLRAQIQNLQQFIQNLEEKLEEMSSARSNNNIPPDGSRSGSDSGYNCPSAEENSDSETDEVVGNEEFTEAQIQFYRTCEHNAPYTPFEIPDPRNPCAKIEMFHIVFGICVLHSEWKKIDWQKPSIFLRKLLDLLYSFEELARKILKLPQANGSAGKRSKREIFTPRKRACVKVAFEDQCDKKIRIKEECPEKCLKKLNDTKMKMNTIIGEEIQGARKKVKNPPKKFKGPVGPRFVIMHSPKKNQDPGPRPSRDNAMNGASSPLQRRPTNSRAEQNVTPQSNRNDPLISETPPSRRRLLQSSSIGENSNPRSNQVHSASFVGTSPPLRRRLNSSLEYAFRPITSPPPGYGVSFGQRLRTPRVNSNSVIDDTPQSEQRIPSVQTRLSRNSRDARFTQQLLATPPRFRCSGVIHEVIPETPTSPAPSLQGRLSDSSMTGNASHPSRGPFVATASEPTTPSLAGSTIKPKKKFVPKVPVRCTLPSHCVTESGHVSQKSLKSIDQLNSTSSIRASSSFQPSHLNAPLIVDDSRLNSSTKSPDFVRSRSELRCRIESPLKSRSSSRSSDPSSPESRSSCSSRTSQKSASSHASAESESLLYRRSRYPKMNRIESSSEESESEEMDFED